MIKERRFIKYKNTIIVCDLLYMTINFMIVIYDYHIIYMIYSDYNISNIISDYIVIIRRNIIQGEIMIHKINSNDTMDRIRQESDNYNPLLHQLTKHISSYLILYYFTTCYFTQFITHRRIHHLHSLNFKDCHFYWLYQYYFLSYSLTYLKTCLVPIFLFLS